MIKNTLNDLNNHLFAQIERLSDEDLVGDELDQELKRADAVSKVAQQIISNGNLALKTMQHMDEYGYDYKRTVPQMLENRNGK